jgi:hypothetical protein
MPRPLMQLGVGDLEALFTKSRSDVKVLKQLEHELQYRQVPRAQALLAEVQAAMSGPAPAASAPSKPPPAPAPMQIGLWERPTTQVTGTVSAPIAAPRPAEPIKGPVSSAVTTTTQPAQPLIPIDDAYKLLKATAGSTWESIEQTRRQLVQQSHPVRLKSMSPERRANALAEAKRANASYLTLSQIRCGGR